VKTLALLIVAAVAAVALAVSAGSAHPATPRQLALVQALHAMHARSGLAHLADSGRRVVILAASQEAEWRGYVAASVYAARGYPLHSVRLLRPKPPGDVTLGFPAVNCACVGPGLKRLAKVRPASPRQILRAIDGAARRAGARVDRIELLHPLAYAPVIVVTARRPKEFLRLGKAASLVGRLYRRIEGAYVFVRGEGGRLLASGGYTARSYTTYGQVGWAVPV
jgi:hypothetical protein